MKLALVLWNGDVGGAEVMTASLAGELIGLGAEATIVFVGPVEPLAERLRAGQIPYRSLSLARGREVLGHPRRFARLVAGAGADGALLVECGYMGAALRAGGYRQPVVAVEHGAILAVGERSRLKRLGLRVARAAGAWADSAEVAVSEFVLERMRAQSRARKLRVIHNGVEPERFSLPGAPQSPAHDVQERVWVAGFAGRLIEGKGADDLIRAAALLGGTRPLRVLIAGDGPERGRLEALAGALGVGERVEFLGLVHDMPRFWQRVDVAVVPSGDFTEACPMTPLEAMAAGKPVVAADNGGLGEIVLDGEIGRASCRERV